MKHIDESCTELVTARALHDDVIKWKHFSRYKPFVRGIHRWPVNSPQKGLVTRKASDAELWFFFDLRLNNVWVNNREAGDWRRHRAHYEVTIMGLLAICAGNSPVNGEFPHKCQWHGALMFSLICAWINSWVNNREAGDLRPYRARSDVSGMNCVNLQWMTRERVSCRCWSPYKQT